MKFERTIERMTARETQTAASRERRTKRIVITLRPSELAKIRRSAAHARLPVTEFVRRNALGQLPRSFDQVADH
jgi:hypothetical protein